MYFNPYAPSIDMLDLPEVAFSRDGQEFNPCTDTWKFKDKTGLVTILFSSLNGFCTPDLISALKKTLIQDLKKLALTTCRGRVDSFRKFAADINDPSQDDMMSDITLVNVQNYRGMLSTNEEYRLNELRGLLKSWYGLGYPGIEVEVMAYLKKTKLKANVRGQAVIIKNPEKGPLVEIDQVNYENKLHAAYLAGDINTRQYALAWLGLTFAPRPCQVASLKITDLVITGNPDGNRTYVLRIPRAKQGEQLSRDQFTDRELHAEGLGPLFAVWANMVIDEFAKMIAAPDVELKDLPLFPLWKSSMHAPGMKYHTTAHHHGAELKALNNILMVASIITGEQIKLTHTKLRHTLATRLAEEGKSSEQIALWMDHTDTRNVLWYTQLTTKFKEKLDERLSMELAPIAQAFLGIIIRDKSDVQLDPSRNPRLRNPEGDPGMGDVGLCGKFGFCAGVMAPIACYTCRQFRPWLQGPHREVLCHLIARREQLLESTKGDERVAGSLDTTILACAEVVRNCMEIQKGAA